MQTHLIAQKISKLSSFYSLSTTLLCFSLSFQGFLLQRNIFWQFLANTLFPLFCLAVGSKNAPTTKVKIPSKIRLTRLAYGRKSWRLHIQKKNLFRETVKNLTRMRTFSFFRYLFHRTGYRNTYKLTEN